VRSSPLPTRRGGRSPQARPHAKQKVFNAAAGLVLLPVSFAGAALAHDGGADGSARSLEVMLASAKHLLLQV